MTLCYRKTILCNRRMTLCYRKTILCYHRMTLCYRKMILCHRRMVLSDRRMVLSVGLSQLHTINMVGTDRRRAILTNLVGEPDNANRFAMQY